jgi:hypothetical protein
MVEAPYTLSGCAHTPAQRRHSRRVLIAAIVYAVTLIPVVYAIRRGMVGDSWRLLLATLPAIPVVGMFASYARYLSEETDEYMRMLVVKQILTATTIAMTVAVVWGFLTDLGGAPPIATYWIAVVWIAAQGAAACIARVRGS